MDCVKKILKVAGIVLAVAGVVAGVYFAVKKFLDKKNQTAVGYAWISAKYGIYASYCRHKWKGIRRGIP